MLLDMLRHASQGRLGSKESKGAPFQSKFTDLRISGGSGRGGGGSHADRKIKTAPVFLIAAYVIEPWADSADRYIDSGPTVADRVDSKKALSYDSARQHHRQWPTEH